MALYYQVKNVYAKFNHQEDLVIKELEEILLKTTNSLEKAEKHLSNKNYIKLEKHMLKMKQTVELLGIDQAFDQIPFILQWIEKKGKRKEVVENFKPFKKAIKLALKEISKDYRIIIE